jgi:hypothetical protein
VRWEAAWLHMLLARGLDRSRVPAPGKEKAAPRAPIAPPIGTQALLSDSLPVRAGHHRTLLACTTV